jgi:hypothetical protein
MREDYARKGLLPPNKDEARSQCLRAGIAAPNLTTVKDFLRFYAATSQPRLNPEKSNTVSLQTIAEWFFAGFTYVTGTETGTEERSEVYYVRASSCQFYLYGKGDLTYSVDTTDLSGSKGRREQASTETQFYYPGSDTCLPRVMGSRRPDLHPRAVSSPKYLHHMCLLLDRSSPQRLLNRWFVVQGRNL